MFLKFERQNSNAFMITLEKSFHQLPGINEIQTPNLYSGTAMHSPVC